MKQARHKVSTSQGVRPDLTCKHHWLIDTPSGPVSRGVCKLCGEEREFKNYLENTPYWEDDLSLDQVSTGARFRVDAPAADLEEDAEG